MKVSSPFSMRIPREIKANLRWRASVHRRAMVDPDFAAAMVDACSMDPIFFANGFCCTYDPRRPLFSKLPFILYEEFQDEAIMDFLRAINDHDMLVEKSRDMGASWICIFSAFWAWRFRKGQSFLFVSRNEDYVDKVGNPKAMFWKFDYLLEHLPAWMQPVGFRKNLHRSKLHILNPENGSVVDGESTTGDVARGDRRTAIFLDEFAAVTEGHSVLASTRDATNCRIFNSTPKGTNNAFYDVRETNIKKLRLHWSCHPLKNVGLYTTAKDGTLDIIDRAGYPAGYIPRLDGKLRSPWYDGECDRCVNPQEIAQELDIDYLGSGFQFFNAEAVQLSVRKYARPCTLKGDLSLDGITADPIEFRESQNSHLELWLMLDKDGNPPAGKRYVIGCDIAVGTGASNSTGSIWDLGSKEKVGQFTDPFITPTDWGYLAVALAKWFNKAFLIWESNGPGIPFGRTIMDLQYGNVYYRKNDESIKGKSSDSPGWASSTKTKFSLLESYRSAIDKTICINRSKEALEETLEYIHEGETIIHARSLNKADPSGAKSNHGDRVIADALAWKGLGERQNTIMVEKPEAPIGSLAWRREQYAALHATTAWAPGW
jgi:hypothetical protein